MHFFLPMRAVTAKFRGKYMDGLKKLHAAGKLALTGQLDELHVPELWGDFCNSLYNADWVGFVKQTFDGNGNAIDYLARYTFKTAISNSRIMNYDGQEVTIQVTDRTTWEKYPVTMTAEDFIQRFLRHVLPTGFPRVRYFGFLSNGRKKKCLELIFRLLNRQYAPSPLRKADTATMFRLLFQRELPVCPCCGTSMTFHPRDKPAG